MPRLITVAALALAACAGPKADSAGGAPEADSGAGPQREESVRDGDPNTLGPYAVGVSTFAIDDLLAQGRVEVELWYPAAAPGAALTTYSALDVLELPAGAYRDVPPDPEAPAFLVAFSHGLGGIRQQNYTMAERLASWGYVVVSADHPGTTTRDLLSNYGELKEALLRRPGTVIAAVDAVYAGAVPAVQPREGGYGFVGHSLGAVTGMIVGGAVIDPEAYQRACAADPRPVACELIGPIDATPEELAGIAPPDPRVQTFVLQSPSGGFAMEPASLSEIAVPFIQHGERDDPAGTAQPIFDLLGGDPSMAIYDGGGHNAPTDMCNISVAAVVAPDCDGPAAGYAEPDAVRALSVAHTVAWLGVHLGGQPALAAHLGPGPGLVWTGGAADSR